MGEELTKDAKQTADLIRRLVQLSKGLHDDLSVAEEAAEEIAVLHKSLAMADDTIEELQQVPSDSIGQLYRAVNDVSHELDELRHWYETLNTQEDKPAYEVHP